MQTGGEVPSPAPVSVRVELRSCALRAGWSGRRDNQNLTIFREVGFSARVRSREQYTRFADGYRVGGQTDIRTVDVDRQIRVIRSPPERRRGRARARNITILATKNLRDYQSRADIPDGAKYPRPQAQLVAGV